MESKFGNLAFGNAAAAAETPALATRLHEEMNLMVLEGYDEKRWSQHLASAPSDKQEGILRVLEANKESAARYGKVANAGSAPKVMMP